MGFIDDVVEKVKGISTEETSPTLCACELSNAFGVVQDMRGLDPAARSQALAQVAATARDKYMEYGAMPGGKGDEFLEGLRGFRPILYESMKAIMNSHQ